MPINDPYVSTHTGPARYEPRVIATFTPSIGRIVHYVSYGSPVQQDGTQTFTSECRAAIITEVSVETEHVGLCVLNPSGFFFNQGVPHYEDDHRGGTWHWPERT